MSSCFQISVFVCCLTDTCRMIGLRPAQLCYNHAEYCKQSRIYAGIMLSAYYIKGEIDMTHLLLAIIYLAFISLGLPDALLGSAWPTMYTEFNVPVSYAGIISMIISLGTIISSLQSDRLTRKTGYRKGHSHQRGNDRRCPTGIFLYPLLLAALPLGHPLRAGAPAAWMPR